MALPSSPEPRIQDRGPPPPISLPLVDFKSNASAAEDLRPTVIAVTDEGGQIFSVGGLVGMLAHWALAAGLGVG
ncbi:hypothetical protein GLOTRDRAFT_130819 [Gloeophyllum trabeum ATCC 11539]|uniref:Uncharacterized protein n=1 Tax=Gloeophyllum trabeum (strain ATCC 11539 / FP-39264 / Madison 617) TaxID=670483 RepID=S7Q0P7_GLOTA|nr:uncharacterized protein GLOTRDRAFT_130819 [Gloeophyllum trabeum ATCC 11539]EPQ53481.1 hypothetical protein GLOTRDRAFT_130819 [Gloeophyllum trabeum ATCC 11539]